MGRSASDRVRISENRASSLPGNTHSYGGSVVRQQRVRFRRPELFDKGTRGKRCEFRLVLPPLLGLEVQGVSCRCPDRFLKEPVEGGRVQITQTRQQGD
jgi:hypothetical protein